MLFTVVDAETKYKAKNAIDTFVYRGGDLISAWLNTAIVAVGSSALAAAGGAVIALLWGAAGFFIGRKFDGDRRQSDDKPGADATGVG